jgi:hypothetical protein
MTYACTYVYVPRDITRLVARLSNRTDLTRIIQITGSYPYYYQHAPHVQRERQVVVLHRQGFQQ